MSKIVFNVIAAGNYDIQGSTKEQFDLMDKFEFDGQTYRIINFDQIPGGTHRFRAKLETEFPQNYKGIGLDTSGNPVWINLEGQQDLSEGEQYDLMTLGVQEFSRKYELIAH